LLCTLYVVAGINEYVRKDSTVAVKQGRAAAVAAAGVQTAEKGMNPAMVI
jgi:hypothetical protein